MALVEEIGRQKRLPQERRWQKAVWEKRKKGGGLTIPQKSRRDFRWQWQRVQSWSPATVIAEKVPHAQMAAGNLTNQNADDYAVRQCGGTLELGHDIAACRRQANLFHRSTTAPRRLHIEPDTCLQLPWPRYLTTETTTLRYKVHELVDGIPATSGE